MRWLLVCLVPLLFSGCDLLYSDYLQRQQHIRERATEEVVIGVAWDAQSSNTYFQSFVQGITLGFERFFPQGGLLGRRVGLEFISTPDTHEETIRTIREFQRNPLVIAVVGHPFSSLASVAAIGYQHHGILFIAPTATNDLALQQNFNLVFRTIMKDSEVYAALLDYAHNSGWNEIAVLYDHSSYGNNVYHNIIAHSHSIAELEAVFAGTYPNALVRPHIRTFVGNIKKSAHPPDAIVTSDTAEYVHILCEELMLHGLSLPILTSFAVLGDPAICAGYAHIHVAEQFIPDALTDLGEEFVTLYEARFKESPNMHAVQGYESMLFLSQAIIKSQSFVPEEIASMLQSNSFGGVSGEYDFDPTGGIRHKRLRIRPLYPELLEGGAS